jgi:AcrR family transcriptional regulator
LAKKASKYNGRIRGRRVARRLEILRAAGKKFRTDGFAETGMRDIADAADLSPANLYNYFRSKSEILFFCQDSALDRLTNAVKQTTRRRVSAAEKLRFIIVAHIRCLLDEVEGSAAHLLPTDLAPRLQNRLVAKRDRYEEGIRRLIQRGMRTGEFALCDPALATRAILGALNWSVRWFNPEGTLTASELGEFFASYLIRGLLANSSVHPIGLFVARPHKNNRNGVPNARKLAHASAGLELQ